LAKGISAGLTPAEGRKFAFTVGAAFLVLAAIMWWRGHATVLAVTGSIGTVLVLAGVLIPGRLSRVYHGWMAFGLALSKITTPILMSLIFFLVLTPMGLLRRAIKGHTLTPQRSAASFWHTRPPAERRGDLKRQF
jgi:hypothetical protein